MKTKLLISIVCTLFGFQLFAAENAPILWPVSYSVHKDMPFVYPLEEISVKFDRTIKLMDDVKEPVTIKCNGVAVAEASTLEIINNVGARSSEGILCVNFEKQNLPKGQTYEICVPEGIIGSVEVFGENQIVNAASSVEFSVPSSLGTTHGIDDGANIP